MIDEYQLLHHLGANIRAARRQCGMSQGDLAAKIGKGRTSVTNIELGRQNVDVPTLYAFAECFGVAPWMLCPRIAEVEMKEV